MSEQATTERALTFGERAVGMTFNPSGSEQVRQLKGLYASVIDTCNEAREASDDPEWRRLWSVAITEAQTAQMWAVKAATWQS